MTEVAMGLLFGISPGSEHQRIFGPGQDDVRWLGLEVLRLEVGRSWQGVLGDEEAALVIMGGRCAVAVEGEETAEWRGLGGRRNVFGGPATAVYVPRRSKLEVTAEGKLELAIIKAPCEVDLPPTLVMPDEVRQVSSGMANWRRDVRLIIPPGSPISQRLIVGETLNPPGNWSGIPPHKHDETSDAENRLEEFYLFKVSPADGFAVQLVYSNDRGQGYIVGNDDVTVFLNSYHPTVAPPGTTVYYLWALAGERKDYGVTTDPRFSWVGSTEAILKDTQRR